MDPDPGGPKTCGSGGSGSLPGNWKTGVITLEALATAELGKTSDTMMGRFFLLFLLDDRRIRIRIRIHTSDLWIREAQKHVDPVDPDPKSPWMPWRRRSWGRPRTRWWEGCAPRRQWLPCPGRLPGSSAPSPSHHHTTTISQWFNQCFGSMTFWYRSGSGDPCLWVMDPDPAIFVIDLQDANKKLIFSTFFSKFFLLISFWRYIYWNHFSKTKKEITKQ